MYVYANLAHVIDAPAPPSRLAILDLRFLPIPQASLRTPDSPIPNIQNLSFAAVKSFPCHTSQKSARNPCIYHTSKFEHPTKDARPERATRAEGPLFAKSSICHRSENRVHNSFICHTSKFIRLKVLCLPHIRKTGGVGGLMLTSMRSGVPGRFLYLITSWLHHLISSGVF